MTDAVSIDAIKRMMLKTHNTASLDAYYRYRFSADASGDATLVSHEQARGSYMHSGSE